MNTKKNNAICSNKKALFNYSILEKIEAGIILKGCEVKSIREGHVSIKESYAKFINNELWLINCHITPYSFAAHETIDPIRTRKLLISTSERGKLIKKIDEKGLTLVPLNLHFSSKQLVKVSLGLGKSKKQHDKRESLKQKSIQKELDKAKKRFY